MALTVRDAEPDDVGFLWLMLTYASSMSPPGEAAVAEAMEDVYLRAYVEGWGRAGDLGVIAVRDGAPVGAAWMRLGGEGTPFRHASREVAELAIASLPFDRGGGAGTALMNGLIERARGRYRALVLSVRDGNPAVRLYERSGFVAIETTVNRVGGSSLVMRLEL